MLMQFFFFPSPFFFPQLCSLDHTLGLYSIADLVVPWNASAMINSILRLDPRNLHQGSLEGRQHSRLKCSDVSYEALRLSLWVKTSWLYWRRKLLWPQETLNNSISMAVLCCVIASQQSDQNYWSPLWTWNWFCLVAWPFDSPFLLQNVPDSADMVGFALFFKCGPSVFLYHLRVSVRTMDVIRS